MFRLFFHRNRTVCSSLPPGGRPQQQRREREMRRQQEREQRRREQEEKRRVEEVERRRKEDEDRRRVDDEKRRTDREQVGGVSRTQFNLGEGLGARRKDLAARRGVRS